jgi:PIN domain nuclease of toxin-antitoxin system
MRPSSTAESPTSSRASARADRAVPRYLLDTHVIYRWMRDDRQLGRRLRSILAHEDCAVSAASIWEMLLKNARGKLPLPKGSLSENLETQGFSVLPITTRHVEATRRFDQAIADPFDRLLVATAAEENMLLLTQDAVLLGLAKRSRLPVADLSA